MEIIYVSFGFFIVCRNILFSELISPLFLISILSLFLYYIPYLILDTFTAENLLDLNYTESFYQLVLFSLLAFTIGYEMAPVGNKSKLIRKGAVIDANIDFNKFNQYATITGFIGVAFYSFFIISSGATYFMGHNAGNFSLGGYIYELRYFVFSAILMLYSARLLSKTSSSNFKVILFFTGFLIFDAYVQQVRGSWIRLMVIYGFSYAFVFLAAKGYRKLKPIDLISRYLYLLPLTPIPILLLTFSVFIRPHSYLPFLDQVSLFFSELTKNPLIVFMGSAPDEGNEFVSSYNAFMAREVSGVFDMGLKWVYPFLNFIPRALWKAKPHWYDFSISVFDIMDKFSFITSVPGSVITGIIDAFYRFAWGSVLFFFFLGLEFKKSFVRAFYGSLHQKAIYICLYIGLFYFISQDALPFVIFTAYMYIPIYFCFKFSKKIST